MGGSLVSGRRKKLFSQRSGFCVHRKKKKVPVGMHPISARFPLSKSSLAVARRIQCIPFYLNLEGRRTDEKLFFAPLKESMNGPRFCPSDSEIEGLSGVSA
jgi:hypothetical protein